MKLIKTTKYATSDGRTFENMERAQAHELTLFFSASLKEGDRLTSSLIIDKMVADPEKVMAKIRDITAVDEAEAA